MSSLPDPVSSLSLVTATRAQLHAIDPATIAAPLRVAVAERCLRQGRSAFTVAKHAAGIRDAEQGTKEARAWMRERKRWMPAGSTTDPPPNGSHTRADAAPSAAPSAP